MSGLLSTISMTFEVKYSIHVVQACVKMAPKDGELNIFLLPKRQTAILVLSKDSQLVIEDKLERVLNFAFTKGNS